MPERFEVDHETVTVRSVGTPGPVVYLHVFAEDGAAEWERCLELGCTDFMLVSIGGLRWDDDMTPWDCPPLFKGDNPCHGKAEAQLERLTGKIMPEVERRLDVRPAYSALAGYSLGGLFATWAAFQTDAFARIASMSGSLWYPRFSDYVAGNQISPAVKKAYFSLGTKESHTRNALLKTVADNTEAVVSSFEARGVTTAFEWNLGGHGTDEDLRTAKGICWMLG